jgi:hypothetical protein
MKSVQIEKIDKPRFGLDPAWRDAAIFEHAHQRRSDLTGRPRSRISTPQTLQYYGMQITDGLDILHIDIGDVDTEALFQGHNHFDDIEGHSDPSISFEDDARALDRSASLNRTATFGSGPLCYSYVSTL